jgi:hypothetical protein
MPGATQQTTWRHIPEDDNLQDNTGINKVLIWNLFLWEVDMEGDRKLLTGV